MNATERQLKSAARGTVNSSNGWDGKSLVAIYNEFRSQYSHRIALEMTERIKQNRVWAVTMDEGLHMSKDQAFAWLVESGVEAGEASCRVWGEETEEVAAAIQSAKVLHWSWINQQHRQELEDARMAG